MNLRALKYFLAVADHRHFGKAASFCCISQPALSMQLQKFEDELGLQLLERKTKSVLLTEHGKRIVKYARVILKQVDELREFAHLSRDPFQGNFTIGIIPTLAPYLLPSAMPLLSQVYPKVRYFLLEEQTEDLLEKLTKGNLDAALLAGPVNEPNLIFSSLFQEEFLLAIKKTHRLAKFKNVKLDDLKNEELLLLEEGHCLRPQVLFLCQDKVSEIQSFKATSLETLRHMIASGMGMTLMPKLACIPNKHLSYIPFSNPKPVREIGLLWRTSSAKKILIEDMIKNLSK